MAGKPGPRILLALHSCRTTRRAELLAPCSLSHAQLASAGFTLRCLATTATKSAPIDVESHLSRMGIGIQRKGRELHFHERGICFRLLRTGRTALTEVERVFGHAIDAAFAEEFDQFRPDALFTFWGSDRDRRRFQPIKQHGGKVIIGLRNHAYTDTSYFDVADAILTPSESLSEYYCRTLGIQSTAIPSLFEEEDVIAPERDPIFLTMINPSIEKGVVVMARLAEELSRRRPDIPILVIESRGSAGQLVACGLRSGFDLRRHENVMISAPVAKPKDLFGPARVLIVPSLQDAAPRVIAEAMMNGVPALVSDRGGPPEMVRDPEFVLPLPADLSIATRDPVTVDTVDPWIRALLPLMDDEALYTRRSQDVRELAQVYRTEALAPRYVRFFEQVLS